MTTLIATHEVDDVAHWLSSPLRAEVFGPIGVTVQTFVDPAGSNKVGLVAEVADMDAFQAFMQSPEAAAAMESDGVRPETLVILVQS